MIAHRRRAAGGLLVRLARAVAAGSLAGAVGSFTASCTRAAPPAGESTSAATLAMADERAPAARLTTPARKSGAPPTVRNECTECHPRAHDAVLGHGRIASGRCADCHATVHQAIQAFYAGTGSGGAVRADPMFDARVACAECHSDTTFAQPAGAARTAAMDRACTSCHGRGFTGMAQRWKEGMSWRTRAVSGYVARAAGDRRLTAAAAPRARVRAAQQALAIVNEAGGLHNVRRADALLRGALASTADAYAKAAIASPGRPALGPDPARQSCVGCHYGIEASRDSVFGEAFDHAAHVVRADVACTDCHSSADYLVRGGHDVDPRHGKTTVTAAGCDGCHHAARQTATCAACHEGDQRLARTFRVTIALNLRAKGAPPARAATFRHLDHPDVACASCHTSPEAVRSAVACESCHEAHHREAGQCAACHGTEIRTAHAAADHLTCTRCHARQTVALLTPDRSFCVSCHLDRADHRTGRECSTCHMQRTPAELRQRILSDRR